MIRNIHNQRHTKKGNDRSFNLRTIEKYFQPEIGRKISIFDLRHKNNILIKKNRLLTSVCVVLLRCVNVSRSFKTYTCTDKLRYSCVIILYVAMYFL